MIDGAGNGMIRDNETRTELIGHLRDLASGDPRSCWEGERKQGLISGIDEVFHFFFDDHDFGGAVGPILAGAEELAAVSDLKHALGEVLDAVGDRGDDEFVTHPLWPAVRSAASKALILLAGETESRLSHRSPAPDPL